MRRNIVYFSLLVKDYDEALAFYVQKLRFELLEDTDQGGGKRWVVVKPSGGTGAALLLAKAKNNEQLDQVGNQSGGRVFLFMETDDFWRDYEWMQESGISFLESPREEEYGTVVVWTDLYGNKWDLIQRK